MPPIPLSWTRWLDHGRGLILPLAIFLAVLGIGLIVRAILFRYLSRWAERSQNTFDDALVAALRGPVLLWILMAAIYVAEEMSALPPRAAALIVKLLLVLWILSLTNIGVRMARALVVYYAQASGDNSPVSSVTQHVASVVVITVGLLILLNSLGVSVTPVLTALGVGGLAVALALQDTLANFFAGFYISIARQVRVGDYIKLDSGQEGFVADINWRSTSLHALPNNLIVIPNAKLGQAIVTNFHLPDKKMALLLPIGVSYDCDPDLVERVLIEEATAAATEIPEILTDPPPMVRFLPGFGASSLDFTLIVHVVQFVDQFPVQSALRKRILRRFRAEGIEIPFPIRTVYFRNPAGHAEPEPPVNGGAG